MKILKYILIILVVILVVFLILKINSKQALAPTREDKADVSDIPITGKYCFARKQIATETAPYNIEEHIVLNFDGKKVIGIKSGTQSGPDMTNGYTGTLAGATITNELGDEMELTYSYTVEGSKNKELEVYAFEKDNLIKKRWALKEVKINNENVLVPDYKGEPTIYTYTKEECVTTEKDNVENYLRKNISTLSPVKSILGGVWYIVSTTIDLDKKVGTIVYEDGHIQEKKDFSYTTNENGEVLSLIIK